MFYFLKLNLTFPRKILGLQPTINAVGEGIMTNDLGFTF